jgi:uncharacterized protein YjiS (DUF1127 family)
MTMHQPRLSLAGPCANGGQDTTLSVRAQRGDRFGLIARAGALLAEWYGRARQRETLARLDAWAMRDLGLTDADVWREQRKYPWEE